MLPHAPGVQMQAIPEDAVHEDSGDEDGEDPDKRISSKKTLMCLLAFFLYIKIRLKIEGAQGMVHSTCCDFPSLHFNYI